ncbi:M20/M25/M40 family metallo-hydrolase, partial [Oceanobacillus saliphilus]
PTNENEWRTPPFELAVADERFWGRGTGDNKGQLLIQIYGLLIYRRRYGQLPYDVELMLEGNEEQGSLTLGQHLHEIQNIYPNKII